MTQNITQNITQNTIEKQLSNISADLDELSNTTKLKDIFKKHKDIKKKLGSATEKLDELEKIFNSEINYSNIDPADKLISDETYEIYSKEIYDFIDDFSSNSENTSIELLMEKYKLTIDKIHLCEKYLESKKMEITYCDPCENIQNNSNQ